MKDLYVLIFCAVLSTALAACSSVSSDGNIQTANVVGTPNSTVQTIGNTNIYVTENADANSMQPVIRPDGETNTADANGAEANLDPNSILGRKKAKMDAMRKAGANGQPKFDEADLIRKANKPAPDNSEFAVILTTEAIEVRTFRNHPQLLKVEKRSNGDDSFLKVFMRNGSVIEMEGKKIPVLSTESAARIMEVSGSTQVSPPNSTSQKPNK